MESKSKVGNITVTPMEDPEAAVKQPEQPNYRNQVPWMSIGCVVTAILCAIGSSILVGCLNGDLQWPASIHLGTVMHHELHMSLISPAVILSVLHSITTLCIGIALKEGVTIAWWRMTLRGQTVEQLNRHYKCGTSIKDAVLAGWSFNWIALATISAFVIGLAQGPLMQDALRTTLSSETTTTTISARIQHGFPNGIAGYTTDNLQQTASGLTPLFLQALKGYAGDSAIKPVMEGCNGTCHTSIKAIGFSPQCSTSTSSYTFPKYVEGGPKHTLFQTQLAQGHNNIGYGFAPSIVLNSTFYTTEDAAKCSGTVTQRNCVLHYGVVEMPIIVLGTSLNNATISLDLSKDPFYTMATPATVQDLSQKDGQINSDMISLWGYILGFQQLFTSQFKVGWGESGIDTNTTGTLAQEFWHHLSAPDGTPSLSCAINFTDPTEQILRAINDISLRAAVEFATATTPLQDVTASEVYAVNRYAANYAYLAASVAVVIVGIMLILPVFWGFWELTRKVSFNPMEMAEAFNAPALQHEHHYRDADHLLEMVGDRKIKYTQSSEDSSAMKHLVVVAEHQEPQPPVLKRRVTGTLRGIAGAFKA